ncbi:tyrosine-type recombinase/integrase [Methylotenera oryzisoli]|nr:tyrosine-type recombinase/integrase [Methylotenera oryzisoli]
MIEISPIIDVQAVMSGKFVFDENFQITKKSTFGSRFWDFYDEALIRQTSTPKTRLQIDWDNYIGGNSEQELYILPDQMIYELKVFTAIYYLVPGVFSTTSKGVKPQTVVVAFRALARLFSAIYRESILLKLSSTSSLTHIQSITDITLIDIKRALTDSVFRDGSSLKRGLMYLATGVISRCFGKSVKWKWAEVMALDFKYAKKRPEYNPVMPNELFRFLSNRACSDVRGFLKWRGIESEDSLEIDIQNYKVFEIPNGAEMFEDYVRIRTLDRNIAHELKVKPHYGTLELRRQFKEKYGLYLSDVLDYLYNVQTAAYTVIGLYTGARYSDLTTFQLGCITKHHGVYVLKGTHVKGEDDSKIEGKDLWPAIPIMRDALKCLEEISKVTFNHFLISGRETVPIGVNPKPMTLTGLAGAINNYLRNIDTSKRWSEWVINLHQLRHTLANQLARADVGLMFIAHQMKHLYTALNALPPSVTLMYGNIADISTQRAMRTSNAYLEAAQSLYDPNMPVSGGGAQEFRERRKIYFEGMAAQGWSTEEVIKHLAKQGLPFASVGTGYCGGRRDRLLKDGTRELSPCIGSLQCNPGRCHQAVITKTHLPQWKKILEHNLTMVADEAMAYAKDVHLAAAEEATQVIKGLGEEIE